MPESSFQSTPLLAAIGVSGVIFGAVYLLMATRKMLFGPLSNPANKALTDINLREVALMLPLVAMAIWIGLRPNDLLGKAAPGLDRVQRRVIEAQQLRTAALAPAPEAPQGVASR